MHLPTAISTSGGRRDKAAFPPYELEQPFRKEIQAEDGRIRHWIFIAELNKYLRVVTLEDGVTLHNAFPDSRFKP